MALPGAWGLGLAFIAVLTMAAWPLASRLFNGLSRGLRVAPAGPIDDIDRALEPLRRDLPSAGAIAFSSNAGSRALAALPNFEAIAAALFEDLRLEAQVLAAKSRVTPTIDDPAYAALAQALRAARQREDFGAAIPLDDLGRFTDFLATWIRDSVDVVVEQALCYVLPPLRVVQSATGRPTLCFHPGEDATAFVARALPAHRVQATSGGTWTLALPR